MIEEVFLTSYIGAPMDNLVKLAHEFLSTQSRGVSSRWTEDKADELLREIGPSLQSFIYKRCDDPHAREDIYQDSLMVIFKKLGQFRGSTKRELWGWCYQITKNNLSDYYRGKRRIELVELDADGNSELASLETTGETPGDRLDHEYARKLVQSAKKPCGSFLNAYYILELDYQTIAEELGMTVDAVRMRIKRCLQETMASIT